MIWWKNNDNFKCRKMSKTVKILRLCTIYDRINTLFGKDEVCCKTL